jgi:archaellum component FlaC
MTIDERLEALTRRHEALTMNLELISRDIETLRTKGEDHDKRIDKLITAAHQDGENIRALARIAEIHERRLTDLEGQ